MRNQEQHKKYCEYIDQPGISAAERVHYSKVYGINRKSILCELSNFNVTEQLPQDLMHVLFEGVFQAHIRELLKYLVEGLSVAGMKITAGHRPNSDHILGWAVHFCAGTVTMAGQIMRMRWR